MTAASGGGGASKRAIFLVGLVALTFAGVILVNVFPSASNQGYAPEQPIPYSHKLHAGQYKIPCLYCHSSAEKSIHAAIPSLNVCMNCHSVVKTESPYIKSIKEHFDSGKPVEWLRVHELPDHVRFPHKRHVAAGIQCQSCHGQIQDMERVYQAQALDMGWCLGCHRGQTTPKYLHQKYYPGEKDLAGKPVAPFNCSACHY